MKPSQATAQVFYLAFSAMSDAERQEFIQLIFSDPLFKQELIDAALIQEGKKVKGSPESAKAYFAKRAKEKV